MRTRSWPTSLITTSVLALFAAPAHAGSLSYETGDGGPHYVFRAEPGERNDIFVERVDGGVRLIDGAAAPTGCPADGPNSVLCPNVRLIRVEAGDGDDRVRARGLRPMIAHGGPGNDMLFGASAYGEAGDDVLQGGPKADLLEGGPGRDIVRGMAGNDDLRASDGEAADAMDGGAGVDKVVYDGAPGPVRVDLVADTGPDGDALTEIEYAQGGDGADELLGDIGRNVLDGGGGDDRLVGGGGDDHLDGGEGADRVDAGAGDDVVLDDEGDDTIDGGSGSDRIRLWRTGTARVRCGSGPDTVGADAHPNGTARVAGDCEFYKGKGPLVRFQRDRMTIRWNALDYPTPCRIEVRVSGLPTRFVKPKSVTVPLRRPALVQFKGTDTCRGPVDDIYDLSALRLTS